MKLSEMKDGGWQHATESDMTACVWAKAHQHSLIPGVGPDLGGMT